MSISKWFLLLLKYLVLHVGILSFSSNTRNCQYFQKYEVFNLLGALAHSISNTLP